MLHVAGLQDVVLCMPHRGRLNLLTGLLSFSPQALFHKVSFLPLRNTCFLAKAWHLLILFAQIQGNAEFAAGEPSTGDVISHLSKPVLLNLSIPGSLGTACSVLAIRTSITKN